MYAGYFGPEFYLILCASAIMVPVMIIGVRVLEWWFAPKKRFKSESEIDAYIKRVMGEE